MVIEFPARREENFEAINYPDIKLAFFDLSPAVPAASSSHQKLYLVRPSGNYTSDDIYRKISRKSMLGN